MKAANTEYDLVRTDGEVEALVVGWNDTHVLFDAWSVEGRSWRRNLSRPILPFMLDYRLFNPSRRAGRAEAA